MNLAAVQRLAARGESGEAEFEKSTAQLRRAAETLCGFLNNEQLLNASVVLFGTRLEQEFPQCHLRLARFRGTAKSAFIDSRQVHGALVSGAPDGHGQRPAHAE